VPRSLKLYNSGGHIRRFVDVLLGDRGFVLEAILLIGLAADGAGTLDKDFVPMTDVPWMPGVPKTHQ